MLISFFLSIVVVQLESKKFSRLSLQPGSLVCASSVQGLGGREAADSGEFARSMVPAP
jgi:hypothetical protein